MNVFDVTGPVMVGPSSSHTAGAVRIGNMAGGLLGEDAVKVMITLYGSFAKTYRGHGTDRALIAGVMGMKSDDFMIRNSLKTARDRGLGFSFSTNTCSEYHPNTALLHLKGTSGREVSVLGSSIGGGNIVISRINSHKVEFTGEHHTLIISHRDTPGVISAVTDRLARDDINIAKMNVYRSQKGGLAMMIIETDQRPGRAIAEDIGKMGKVMESVIVKPVI